jgi:hypothetical protein
MVRDLTACLDQAMETWPDDPHQQVRWAQEHARQRRPGVYRVLHAHAHRLALQPAVRREAALLTARTGRTRQPESLPT